MNVKKTVKKIVALGTGAGLVGMTLMSAMALAPDLTTYPDFVLEGNQFDGKIVVGSTAKPEDILGSIDIATSLQAVSTTAVSTGDSVTTTNVEGDAKKIEDSGNILELGEEIGSVIETLTDDDLMMLEDGTVEAKGRTSYSQVLELDGAVGTGSGVVGLFEDHDKEIAPFLFFDDDEELFNYELEFTSGLESDIDDDDKLEDFEDETIYMLGQKYSIIDAETDGTDSLTMELIAGDVTDTLEEGTSKTYEVDGKDYEVTVVAIGESGNDQTVKFLIGTESTKALEAGETDTLDDGLEIGVREILETTAYLESSPRSIVEFYLGANKIIFEDDDITAAGGGSVEIDTNDIGEATLEMSGTITGDDFRLDTIEYSLAVDADYRNDIYVGVEEGVRDALDEPEGMLNPDWDIMFYGLTEPDFTEIQFNPKGDDQYDLTFENRKGDEFTVPLMNTEAASKWGDEDYDLVFWEVDTVANNTPGIAADFNIDLDDYFIVTDIGADATADNADDTYVLQFVNVEEDDTQIILEHVSTGEEIPATYDSGDIDTVGDAATGEFSIGGKKFDFWVWDSDGNGAYVLAVDLNNNGGMTNDQQVDIVTKGGAVLSIDDFDISDDAATITLTTFAEDVDGNNAQAVDIDFTSAGTEVDLGVDNAATGSNGVSTVYQEADTDADETTTMTAYGTKFLEADEDDDADSLMVYYPLEQVEALVYVVGGSVQTSSHTVGGGTAELVNPLGVGLAVLDVDVSLDSDNLIVVGGPCVNNIAADLMQSGSDCAEGFEDGMAIINTYDTDNHYAVLVAGGVARDTVRAAQVLAEAALGPVDNLEGTEVEIIFAGANDVTIRAPVEDVEPEPEPEADDMDDMDDGEGEGEDTTE